MSTKQIEGCWWMVFLLGGVATIYVIAITVANLNSEVIFNVLLPGTAIGLLLMIVGRIGVHRSSQADNEVPIEPS